MRGTSEKISEDLKIPHTSEDSFSTGMRHGQPPTRSGIVRWRGVAAYLVSALRSTIALMEACPQAHDLNIHLVIIDW